MRDVYLCLMAGMIVVAYLIYMTAGPGGDGIIFGSVIGAVCALAGVHYGRRSKSTECPVPSEESPL